MIIEKAPPSMGRWDAMANPILGDGSLGNGDAQLRQLAMHAGSSPERVGPAHVPYQLTYFGSDAWSSRCAFYLFIRQPHGAEVSPAARNTLDSARIPRASKLLICGLFQKGRVLAQDGVRDLSLAGWRIYLEYERWRVNCPGCGGLHVEHLDWLANNSRYT